MPSDHEALPARYRIAGRCLLLLCVVLLGLAACGTTTRRPQATPLWAAEHGKWSIDWAPASRAHRLAIAAAWLNHDTAVTPGEREFVTPADLASHVNGPAAGTRLNPNLNAAAQEAIRVVGQNQLDDGLHGGGLVGRSMADVKKLLGAPDDEQVVARKTVWYYMPPVAPTDAAYAVVFDGNTVSQVVSAGS